MDPKLPESGVWTNYKYPIYLRNMRSARFVQDQIYISSVEFKPGDARVWVQFRLRDWQPFNAVYLGNRKWLLRKDSSDIGIPLELMRNGIAMDIAYDMFEPVKQGNVLGTAYNYYADGYQCGNRMVRFKATGEVVGLDSFVAFKPMVDYSEEPGTGDRILLQSVSGVWKKFGLRIVEMDGLEICALKGGKLGKRVYRLVRELKPILM